MSKYEPLYKHLCKMVESEWDASFEDIERILGFTLPESARQYNPWWANQSGAGHVQSRAWQDAGWRTEQVRPLEGRVRFVRERDQRSLVTVSAPQGAPMSFVRAIAEAKARISEQLGIDERHIDITIRL